MDPDVCLAEMRKLTAPLRSRRAPRINLDDARRLAELVDALDGWLSGGGFPPAAWDSRPTATAPRRFAIHTPEPGE